MEHRKCIGGGEKTKQKLSNLLELGKVGEAVIKGAIISKYLVRADLSNEQNKNRTKCTGIVYLTAKSFKSLFMASNPLIRTSL